MSKVISIISGKGGSGVSSICVAVGLCLAQKDKRVLLIDYNAGFRTLDTLLQVSTDVLFDISDIVSGNCDAKDAIKSSELNKNLFLLPAPSNSANSVSPDILNNIVKQLKNEYDFVIIDIPCKSISDNKSFVNQVDSLLVLTEPNLISVRSAKKIKSALSDTNIQDIRLIINKFSKKKFFKEQEFKDLDAVIDEAETQLIAVIPYDEIYFKDFNCNKDNHKKANNAISALSDRLCGINVPICYKSLN